MTLNRWQLPSIVIIHVPLKFTVRGGRKTIIGELPHIAPKTRFDDSIMKALARAYRWKQKLEDGTYAPEQATFATWDGQLERALSHLV